ncbi:DUF6153 family protein [Salinibacterium sp. SYSU T00001]|uniref:DUF6153 family protein n=1 Tax=Homoserinimonas sedimenticola TaxID=2986805 RepID=UPI002235E07D|nr:DUF6153 family protein [Salinibacterium sedimenticola]MCW4386543.1 DUF6153 family protein [Salinibacterium sedimenticola]
MSMIEVGHALRPRRSLWRTLIFSLAAIGAIVVGLVAMHSLNIEGGHSGHAASSPVAASADHHADADAGAADAAAVDPLASPAVCDSDCEHAMTVMACILALMVTLIILGASRATSISAGILRLLSPVLELKATLAPAAPPSLHVLSISRT